MRRSTITLVLAIAVIFLFQAVAPAGLHAQKHEKLYGLFQDVKGWKGDDPEGMAMDMPGMKMIQAIRTYSKGDKEVVAMIIIGNAATTAPFMGQLGQSMNFESDEAKVELKEMDGFTVYSIYDKEEHSGTVTVLLTKSEEESSMFVITFEDNNMETGLKLAKSFDWKEMKKKIEALD
ncbi:MAG: hypothetical protein KAV42_10895 [Candidatus Krumholzibacteria bacterium]|nr:hypothetical protein [Candidatus Krumholzibacteria bacterium]